MRRPTLALLALSALASAQDLPKQARDRHEYDLIDVDWSVRLAPDKGAIDGIAVNTVTATKAAPLYVFDCAKLTVSKVTLDGKDAPFKADGKVLAVPSSAPLGKTQKVAIFYSGLPEAGVYFVPASRAFPAKGPVVYTQGEMEDTRYWLPTYDSPNDKATSRGTVTVPDGWLVLSNGLGADVSGPRDSRRYSWVMDKPHSTYLISFVAGPYTEIPDGTSPVPVSIWTPAGLESWGKNAFGGTDAIVRFYAKLTGTPYPWPKYAQSAVPDFMFGGMENVSATTQTLGALFPDEVKGTQDGTGLAAHELAHQWFGDLVTTPRWDDTWINEGWASFLPTFWVREKEGEEAYDIDRYGTLEGAKGAMNGSPRRSMVRSDWKIPMEMFDGFAYGGGAARMFALMHGVGEARFWAATKAYLAEYGGKNVDTAGFFASFGKSLGADLSTFETQWFRTPSPAPKIEVRRVGKTVILHQAQPKPFAMYLDVWALGKDDVWKKSKVALRTADLTLGNAGEGPVLVDAEVFFPIDVTYADLTKEERLRLWAHAPNSAARLRMFGGLTTVLSPDETNGLIREASPLLKVRLARYSTSTDDLVAMTKGGDERLARAALDRLGELPATDAAKARLREVWESKTANPDLRFAALESLYTLEKDPKLIEAAWGEERYDNAYRTWALNLWATTDPDTAREMALAAVANGNAPLRLTAIGVLGRVKDKPGERRAYDALAVLMTERSNSPLRAAIRALAEYGDPAAIPLLEARKDHGLHFVRGDVERALKVLGDKK